jgi:pimeloyl-ACP methyl ester carboxylesterase
MTPVAESERMQAAIRGSALVRIPRAGHMSNLENPGPFNEALGGYLSAWLTEGTEGTGSHGGTGQRG